MFRAEIGPMFLNYNFSSNLNHISSFKGKVIRTRYLWLTVNRFITGYLDKKVLSCTEYVFLLAPLLLCDPKSDHHNGRGGYFSRWTTRGANT